MEDPPVAVVVVTLFRFRLTREEGATVILVWRQPIHQRSSPRPVSKWIPTDVAMAVVEETAVTLDIGSAAFLALPFSHSMQLDKR